MKAQLSLHEDIEIDAEKLSETEDCTIYIVKSELNIKDAVQSVM